MAQNTKFEEWYQATGLASYEKKDLLRAAWDAGARAQEIMNAHSSCGLGDDN